MERFIVQKAYIVIDTKNGMETVDWFDDYEDAEAFAEELEEDADSGIEP